MNHVATDDLVLQTMPLGFQWPTVDPFLFCVHHLDHYPAANDSFGPAAPLDGRDLGSDFAGVDGWRMYHGLTVPGFPQHPHRGFETVTYVRQGLVDHADSLGAAARYGRGDVQWLTTGQGIVHAEMFPLLDRDAPNTVELFQIWLNLPAASKLVPAHFTMLWDASIPRLEQTDDQGRAARITVIAGTLGGVTPPPPPPDSYASAAESDVAIWHLHLDPGAEVELPAAAEGTLRTLYLFDGDRLTLAAAGATRADHDATTLEASTAAVVRGEHALRVTGGLETTECLVLQGRPLAEPVAQYGPFVMNTRAEIAQAIDDYQRTGFGGWPWPEDGPVHGQTPDRFARHADGRREQAPTA